MTGLIIELAISWLLLWFLYRTNLSALGIMPTKKRRIDFVSGLLIASACCVLYFLLLHFFTNTKMMVNPSFSLKLFAGSTWWTARSVLFEELIFRGVLLYVAIEKLGIRKACLISAAAFGIYHWFSYNAFGNPVQMIFVFLMTGLWGLIYAFAFARTRSLYLSVGLHLGWNLVNIVIFSNGPLGNQFILSDKKKPEGLLSLALFIFQVLAVPAFSYWYIKKFRPGNRIKKHQPIIN